MGLKIGFARGRLYACDAGTKSARPKKSVATTEGRMHRVIPAIEAPINACHNFSPQTGTHAPVEDWACSIDRG
jgi:hypothetical protein